MNREAELIDLLQEFKALQRRHRANQKAAKQRAEYEWAMKLSKVTTFEIDVVFIDKLDDGSYCDSFEVEGIENAMMIFNEYRRIGFSLELRWIELRIKDGKRVKKVNFKY